MAKSFDAILYVSVVFFTGNGKYYSIVNVTTNAGKVSSFYRFVPTRDMKTWVWLNVKKVLIEDKHKKLNSYHTNNNML